MPSLQSIGRNATSRVDRYATSSSPSILMAMCFPVVTAIPKHGHGTVAAHSHPGYGIPL